SGGGQAGGRGRGCQIMKKSQTCPRPAPPRLLGSSYDAMVSKEFDRVPLQTARINVAPQAPNPVLINTSGSEIAQPSRPRAPESEVNSRRKTLPTAPSLAWGADCLLEVRSVALTPTPA